ncbi:DPP IV N-terminal domain-containing protein, partial [candidate division KSB1 bacterium]
EQVDTEQTAEEQARSQRPPQPGVISSISWSEDGSILEYVNMGRNYKCDLNTLEITDLGEVEPVEQTGQRGRGGQGQRQGQGRGQTGQTEGRQIPRPSRGHQFMTEQSPDGQWYAVCKDYNVWLENDNTGQKIQVTTGGNIKYRYGTANWTYGEELGVRNGMWWTPDSKKLIYYVFSEEHVQDFYLIGGLTETYTRVMSEGYIKAGYPNPIVSLEIYDLQTRRKIPVNVGQENRDQYIYSMRLTPDGSRLLFNRIDRYHHDLDVLSLNYNTGRFSTVVSEHQDTWQTNSPRMTYLDDGQRFIWPTEKTMWQHYELRDLSGNLINTITAGEFPDLGTVKIDEENNLMYYRAASDVHPLCEQLHKVNLDGTGQKRLTQGSMNFGSFNISPDNKFFTTAYQNVETPPSTPESPCRGPETGEEPFGAFYFQSD